MYFSSPHLLCLQATKCMMQLHAQIENLKTETGSKEAAATTPKLCALSPKSQPSQGSVKKRHYQGCIWRRILYTAAARLWSHGLWLGRGKDAVPKSQQPVTLPATTPPASDYMLNSSNVLVLRRVYLSPSAEARWHAYTKVSMVLTDSRKAVLTVSLK